MHDDNAPVTAIQLDRAIESLRDEFEGRIADLESTIDDLRVEIIALQREIEGGI